MGTKLSGELKRCDGSAVNSLRDAVSVRYVPYGMDFSCPTLLSGALFLLQLPFPNTATISRNPFTLATLVRKFPQFASTYWRPREFKFDFIRAHRLGP